MSFLLSKEDPGGEAKQHTVPAVRYEPSGALSRVLVTTAPWLTPAPTCAIVKLNPGQIPELGMLSPTTWFLHVLLLCLGHFSLLSMANS